MVVVNYNRTEKRWNWWKIHSKT